MKAQNTSKSISTAFKKSDVDGTIDTSKNPPVALKEKLEIARKIVDIPAHFKDNIDLIYEDEQIILKWYPSKVDEQAEALHKSGLVLARQGKLAEAIEKWIEATSINAMDPDYFFNLGIAYFEQKKYLESVDNLTRVLAICPFYIKAHLILGTAFLKLRKFEFAKNHFSKSIRYNKSNSLSFLNLGAVHSILREYDEGIAMFEKAIALAPLEPRAYLGLAKIYSTMGNIKKANEYFKKVIDLDKKGPLANYAKRSIVLSEQKDLGGSGKSPIANMASANPEDYYSEGYRHYISGDYSSSEMMYQKYLSAKPNDDYVWYALGEVQLRGGKPENALESFKRAFKLYQNKGLYLKALAMVFDKLNKPEKVVAAASKAKEFGKTDSVTYCLWGKALHQLGNHEEAVLMLEHAIKSNQNNFLAKYYIAEAMIQLHNSDDAMDYLYELKELKVDTPLKHKAQQLFDKMTNR